MVTTARSQSAFYILLSNFLETNCTPTILDNYMRQHKHSGAWMSDYRAQSRSGSADGSSVIPIICNNNNFAKGSEVCTAIAVIQCNTYYISYFCVSTVILFTNLKLIYPAMFPPLSLSCSFSLSLPPLSFSIILSQDAPTLLSFDDARTLFHEFG